VKTKKPCSTARFFSVMWNYITLLEHFLNGTDRLRFAPAERSGAAEFPPTPPFRRALAGGQNFFGDNQNSYMDL